MTATLRDRFNPALLERISLAGRAYCIDRVDYMPQLAELALDLTRETERMRAAYVELRERLATAHRLTDELAEIAEDGVCPVGAGDPCERCGDAAECPIEFPPGRES